ncbi:MAG TPA: GtrA family protein, partial [Chloroflexota bacterium]|nr:GtrA family protein [Chloroflexota bacterium]
LSRYTAGSAICFVISEIVFVAVFWPHLLGAKGSSLVASVAGIIPGYYLNRTWTWGRRERSDLWREVVPYWAIALGGAIAAALAIDAGLARQALRSWTLDQDSAVYHGTMPGSPAPPFIRLDADHVLWSAAGLLTAPMLFLTRELRRRYAREYHDTAHLREGVFRQDLYGLFGDRRFVTSTGRVELRREGGDARTDLDALIFDRKSGSLGVFELKAHDPFSRSTAERQRQRDNFFHANQQVSAVAHWLQRNDATGLLARIDPRVARTFKVQRVYLFVLGRYVAHFADGPAPDHRAAWGTWPQVLRLVGERPFGPTDANPLGSLHTRLVKDTPLSPPVADPHVREITLGVGRVRVFPSFAEYKSAIG